MKFLYKTFIWPLPSLILIPASFQTGKDQGTDGQLEGGTVFDTTIDFSDGSHRSQIKFPKLYPRQGMVTCAKLTMNVTSTLNFMFFENRDNSPKTAHVVFSKDDVLTRFGVSTPLLNSEVNSYWSYNLVPKDLVPNSGPDYIGVGPVETFNNTKSCQYIRFQPFHSAGGYSLIYNYTASGTTQNNKTSNWIGGVDASGPASYKLELCYCPVAILPLNIGAFDVNKLPENKADFQWNGIDDSFNEYHYEAEVSRDNNNYLSIGSFLKNINTNDPFKLMFTAHKAENGIYYFRIKQVYSKGCVRYSNIRLVLLENSETAKFSVYSNPSKGIVGIKFDNISGGQFAALIYNTQGQMMAKNVIVVVAGSSNGNSGIDNGSLLVKAYQQKKLWIRRKSTFN